MRVKIDEDELWPDMHIVKDLNHIWGNEYDIPDSLVDEYIQARNMFMDVRDKLIDAMEEGR